MRWFSCRAAKQLRSGKASVTVEVRVRGQRLGNYLGALRTGAVRPPASPLCPGYLDTYLPLSPPHPSSRLEFSSLGKLNWNDVGSGCGWLKTGTEFELRPPFSSPALSRRPAASPTAASVVDWKILFLGSQTALEKNTPRHWNVRVPQWKAWHSSPHITWSLPANNSFPYMRSLQSAFTTSLLNRIRQPKVQVILEGFQHERQGPKQTSKEKPCGRWRCYGQQRNCIFLKKKL